MCNIALNAIMNLFQKGFPQVCLPNSFNAAVKYIRSMVLGYEKIHVCKIIVCCFARRSMSNLMCAQYVVKWIQDGRIHQQERSSKGIEAFSADV
jgi:hypothetical protein